MVDLLGMFRRRPAKRNAPGFARAREDITALGDRMGDMLASPVRDAPSIVRDGSRDSVYERPAQRHPEKPRPPRAKTNGATAPFFT